MHNVNALNVTTLFDLKWLILCFVNCPSIKIKMRSLNFMLKVIGSSKEEKENRKMKKEGKEWRERRGKERNLADYTCF